MESHRRKLKSTVLSNRKLPTPFFDGLNQMLSGNDFQPDLSGTWLQDYRQAKNFLLSYRGSLDTFNSYRRELERFLQWCHLKADKTLTQIRREDFENFLAFCQKPLKSWITLKVEKRFSEKNGERKPNEKWRPFVVKISKTDVKLGKQPDRSDYLLSEKAIRALFAVISSFYNYLIQEDYTLINPVLLIRQKSKYFRTQQTVKSIRRLSELQWGYVIETAEMMADDTPEKHVRTFFIMSALYGLYLRISELTASERWIPTMGDFHRDSEGRWWFLTVGKGNKERKISVSIAMLKAFKSYRKTLGLPPLPSPNDKTPLLTAHNTNRPLKSTRYIRELVQACFDCASQRLIDDNQHEEAAQLGIATVHWLRHTGISDDVKIRPREHVRDDAGHSSGSITDKYIDIKLHERHQSAKRKRIKPEFLEES